MRRKEFTFPAEKFPAQVQVKWQSTLWANWQLKGIFLIFTFYLMEFDLWARKKSYVSIRSTTKKDSYSYNILTIEIIAKLYLLQLKILFVLIGI